jgi:ABC-type multidrug transport system ATPase subunit
VRDPHLPNDDRCGAPNGADHPDTQPAIRLSEITKQFGRFAALRGITAEFAPGNLYVILGENGAGKSTLLRIITGLLTPSRGKVTVLGSEDLRAVAMRVGYMGHAPLLYDEMDAMENLRYFAGLYGIREEGRCEDALRQVGLDPKLTRRVGQYSQGMRQRTSLARAIVHNPELMLLDEPFSNVDVASAREMSRLLGMMRDGGKTIVVVTHQAPVMEPVCDESVLISAGRITAREKGIPPYLLSPFTQEIAK